ncbi:MAG TPA: PP2C family protein-serine/threonine phosphatase [Anaerolineales bacterium]|nr:PP2C family protein-serine/threonine phosphatase [Anaerolineales bacterium]
MRETVGRSSAPGEAITKGNRRICQESSQGLYITLIDACLDPEMGKVTYANAGHNPGLHYQAETRTIETLMPTGMPLGIDDEAVYGSRDLYFNPGDVLLLYTDGVTEAIDSAGEEFGLERLKSVLQVNGQKPVVEIIAEILREAENFTGAAPLFDDTTLVIFKRLS